MRSECSSKRWFYQSYCSLARLQSHCRVCRSYKRRGSLGYESSYRSRYSMFHTASHLWCSSTICTCTGRRSRSVSMSELELDELESLLSLYITTHGIAAVSGAAVTSVLLSGASTWWSVSSSDFAAEEIVKETLTVVTKHLRRIIVYGNRSLVFSFEDIKISYPTVHTLKKTSIIAGDLRPILFTVNLTSVGTGDTNWRCA